MHLSFEFSPHPTIYRHECGFETTEYRRDCKSCNESSAPYTWDEREPTIEERVLWIENFLQGT